MAAETIDIIKGAFSDAFALWERNGKGFFVDLVKITFLQWFVIILFAAIVISLAFFTMGDLSASLETVAALLLNLPFLLMTVLLLLIAYFASAAFGSVAFNAVGNRAIGEDTAVINQFKANFVPYSLYIVLILVLKLILFTPLIGGYLISSQDGEAGSFFRVMGSVCMFGFISAVLYLLLFFFIQFATFELIIGMAGVFDSLRRSYRLFKMNIVVVFLFDVLYAIIVLAINSIIWGVQWIFERGMRFMLLGGNVAGAILGGLLYAIVTFVLIVLMEFVALPIRYSFWRKLGASSPAKPEKKKQKT